MKIDFKKLIIGVLVFSVLLVAFSLVYYYVYFLPQLETKQIELERQKQEQLEKQLEEDRKEREGVRERNRYLLEQCLEQAYDVYITGWNRDCEELGKEKDCGLPTNLAERWDKIHQERRDDCFKKYPLDWKWIIYRELFEEEKFNKRRLPDEAVEEIIKIVYVATKLNVYGMEQSNLLELEEIKRSLGYVLVLRDEKAMKEGGVTREKVLEIFKKRRTIV